jgi:hypothetical protein
MKVMGFVASVVAASLIAGAGFAGETVWKPPQEIGQNAAPQAQADPTPVPVPVAPAPTAAPAKKSGPATADERRAKAKECSVQADAKGLHGKERKIFRDECKKG